MIKYCSACHGAHDPNGICPAKKNSPIAQSGSEQAAYNRQAEGSNHSGATKDDNFYKTLLEEKRADILSLYGDGWKMHGPYDCGDDRRRRVVLSRAGGVKTTRLLAKVFLEVKLGRLLSGDEEVDHIDNDELNDTPENLQVLSRKDNVRKATYRKYGEPLILSCAQCGTPVLRSLSRIVGDNVYCSNACRALGPSDAIQPISSVKIERLQLRIAELEQDKAARRKRKAEAQSRWRKKSKGDKK